MNSFSFVIPYYRNPEMLKLQVENWNLYPEWIRDQVRVILIDDCSPEPAEPIFRKCELRKSLYRINEDIVFNAHGARNLGAKVIGKDDAWGLYTDMDIMFPVAAVERILSKKWNAGRHYTFEREFVDGRPRKYHCNSLLMIRSAYWSVGGMDEDFCGSYGGDGIFHRALERGTPRQHWDDVVCLGFNGTVADCSTRDLDRQGPLKKEYLRRRDEKKAKPHGLEPKNPLRFTWDRII